MQSDSSVDRTRAISFRSWSAEPVIVASENTYASIRQWAVSQGVSVQERKLSAGKAGEFDGLGVIMNREYSPEERAYYLVHALGSIVSWSLNKRGVQAIFDELRTAIKSKAENSARLEKAIDRYRAFESESSGFAVWLLAELGSRNVIGSYTNFMRADLEAMTEFHRHGHAPVWRVFLARWNEDVARGRREVLPFNPKPIVLFRPLRIEKQEILQRQDDEP